ncbi:MAG: GatB/YqeY domain-containing protein [candidate division KSB1 bacterium]|nr:GatB/YqeY domain-containing protein [candidate division KSB1 bacterium]MDZ7345354.1 GatB/YqeY domain-containing protein [candidate division KSB1 bacterium]
MSLFDQLTEDMKAAMKAGDKDRLSAIRLLRGALKNEAIDKRRDLTAEEEIAVLAAAAKKRQESIDAYRQAGREDLAQKEEQELALIRSYLPKQLSREELLNIIDAAIAQSGAKTVHDLGKVMPIVMQQVKGRADGREVNALVRERLSI